jgi:hypothetical protein
MVNGVSESHPRPSGTPRYWPTGTQVLWRSGDGPLAVVAPNVGAEGVSIPQFAEPMTVVCDDADALVAWLPTGTPVRRVGRADGRGKRDDMSTLFTARTRLGRLAGRCSGSRRQPLARMRTSSRSPYRKVVAMPPRRRRLRGTQRRPRRSSRIGAIPSATGGRTGDRTLSGHFRDSRNRASRGSSTIRSAIVRRLC